MSTTNYPAQSFEAMSRIHDDAVTINRLTILVAQIAEQRDEALAALAMAGDFVTANDEMGQTLTEARATLAKIRTIVTGHEAALVVGRVLAALDEGSTQPEGTK